MNEPAITHKYTLICDEMRREDNGKLLIVGMYLGNMAVPQIPFVLPSLTFVTFLQTSQQGLWGMKFRLVHLETGRKVVEGHASINVNGPGQAVAPISIGGPTFQAVGDYQFVIEIEDHQDPIITDLRVDLRIPGMHTPQGPTR